MNGLTANRTPEVIATEINVIKGQARDVYVRSAIEIGRRLYEVKAMVPYGKWGEWLENNVDYSVRTAQNLIAVYEEYGRNGDAQAIAGLSYTQTVMLLRLDGETRETLLEEKDVPGMSTRELEEEIRKANEEIEKRQLTIDQLMKTQAQAEAADALRKELKQAKAEEAASRQRMGDAVKRAEDVSRENLRLKRELEEERSKPEPKPVIEQVKVTPPEVQEELDRLRRQAQDAPSKEVILLRNACGELKARFEQTEQMLAGMAETQPEEAARYRRAVAAAAAEMARRMGA